jgi:hypothetical protein
MLLYLSRSKWGTPAAFHAVQKQPTDAMNTDHFPEGAAQRPSPGEDHLMAGTINSLNEDRSRLAWRVRQAGVPSEIIDELINDNIVARYARRFRLFLQGAPGDVLMIIINGVVKVHCAQPDGRRFLVERWPAPGT